MKSMAIVTARTKIVLAALWKYIASRIRPANAEMNTIEEARAAASRWWRQMKRRASPVRAAIPSAILEEISLDSNTRNGLVISAYAVIRAETVSRAAAASGEVFFFTKQAAYIAAAISARKRVISVKLSMKRKADQPLRSRKSMRSSPSRRSRNCLWKKILDRVM